jgi:hypothetical protein
MLCCPEDALYLLRQMNLIAYLNARVREFNQPSFISKDPISIPHAFSKKADIEIAGLFASIFAWGIRTTIINKSRELLERMDNAPHQFVTQHQPEDLKKLLGFKHRTFNDTDLLYFIEFLHHHYASHKSLETAFSQWMLPNDQHVGNALKGFHSYFFSLQHVPSRTIKHVATPERNSSCKRLNMYLRWMVRNDQKGVDFGLWKSLKPAQLICPLDVHVQRTASMLGLLKTPKSDWTAALELTSRLREMDPTDPVKYDFALFGMGVLKKGLP